MKVLHRQQFSLSGLMPTVSRTGLALGAMAIPTRNGEHSITCLELSRVPRRNVRKRLDG